MMISACLVSPKMQDFAHATQQYPEMLVYEGQREQLPWTYPLEGIPKALPKFDPVSTMCRRGYHGTWTIEHGILYLSELRATVGGKPYGLQDLFPGSTGNVHAAWFTGTLILPRGEVLQRLMHYGPTSYEKELHIQVRNGEVAGTALVDRTAWKDSWVPKTASGDPQK